MKTSLVILLLFCLYIPSTNAFLFEFFEGLFGGWWGGGNKSTPQPPKKPEPQVPVPPFAKIVRSFDGSGNNMKNPNLGKAQTELPRLMQAAYADGFQKMIDRGNPRQISNIVGKLETKQPISLNKNGLSMLFVLFGQFIDHDLDLTIPSGTQKALIKVPRGDPAFDKKNQGNKNIQFSRSLFTLKNKRRIFANTLTSFIDGSQVYGSDQKTAKSLRQGKQGKLKMNNNMLIKDNTGAFLAGDIRVNQNIGLTSIQTIFARQHNRQCEIYATKFPGLGDEQIFQMARNKIAGFIQKITFDQYLPHLLGQQFFDKLIGEYQGYNPNVNPSVALQFSTAAYRIGHPLLTDSITLFDYFNNPTKTVQMKDMFLSFQSLKKPEQVDFIINGIMRTQCKHRNNQLVDGLRNLLVQFPGIIQDLFSLNIQRGRDHGMPDYNSARRSLGFTPVKSFSQITSDKQTVARLTKAYGNVNNIDLWVGIISQQSLQGGNLGVVGSAIVADTFKRVRNGDRFWYKNAYPDEDVNNIDQTSFKDIVLRNTKLSKIPDGFIVPGFVIVDKLVNNNNQPILDGGVNSFDFQTKETITKPNEKDIHFNFAVTQNPTNIQQFGTNEGFQSSTNTKSFDFSIKQQNLKNSTSKLNIRK